MNKAIEEIEEKEIKEIVDPAYTGNETTSQTNIFPPNINILQSDKQYRAFEDGDEITQSQYGQLFVRYQTGNTQDDLQDELSGTIVKLQEGWEGRDEGGKPCASGVGLIRGMEAKAEWQKEYPTLELTNMVKIVLALEDAETTLDRLQDMREDNDVRLNPLAIFTVKGSGWTPWIDVQEEMDKLALKTYNKGFGAVLVSTMKLRLGSKFIETEDYDFYAPTIDVSLTSPEEAVAFSDVIMSLKDAELFREITNEGVTEEEVEEMKERTREKTEEVAEGMQELDKIINAGQ